MRTCLELSSASFAKVYVVILLSVVESFSVFPHVSTKVHFCLSYQSYLSILLNALAQTSTYRGH